MRALTILGSSGSIGECALRVAAANPEHIRVTGLAVRRATDKILVQARRFGVRRIAVADAEAAAEVRRRLPAGVSLLVGDEGVVEIGRAHV